MKDQDNIKSLLQKHKTATLSDTEKAILDKWYLHIEADNAEELPEAERLNAFNTVSINLEQIVLSNRSNKLWARITVAASILFILSFGTYFIWQKSHTEENWVAENFKNDITPGSNSATLKLGNGKILALNARSNGQLALQGNIAVKKSADGQLEYHITAGADKEVMVNTLATNRKEQYKVVLADGTNVWLNSASSLKYPTQFTGKYRDVIVTGEAYFEVAHNAAQPFRVKSAGQTVEVLGTHFNVNAYADEPNVRTTLLEGSVKVYNGTSLQIIKPGEEAVLKNSQLSVNKANVEEALAWKNGYFRFNNENIEGVMRKLSRWYDIDVKYAGPVSEEEYNGTISRFRNISEVLKKLQYSGSIHFKIEGRRVTVSK